MILKQSWLNLTDSSSILWTKIFHLYSGFYRKITSIGYFVKGSVRVLKPQLFFYKGFTKKKIKKGFIRRSLIIRVVYKKLRIFLPFFTFKTNSSILIKKKNIILSKYLLGPANFFLKNKKIITLFKYVI